VTAVHPTDGPPAETAGYSAAQVRAAEAPHLAAGEPLMRRAAAALAAAVRRAASAADAPAGPVLVLAGSGDNGGDALFAAT
jgi:NAD(P)H-hydrate epimerase